LIEVPHQASLHNGEREVYVLRSDNGQTWHEHPSLSPSTDVNDALDGCFQGRIVHATSSLLNTSSTIRILRHQPPLGGAATLCDALDARHLVLQPWVRKERKGRVFI